MTPRFAVAVLGVIVALVGTAGCAQDDQADAATSVVQACRHDAAAHFATTEPSGHLDVDPHTLSGPATATIADDRVRGVEPAVAQLPVTVESCDGETVVIDDTSRILAVDLNGSLADVVYGLGLGDQVVGRDRSTAFPEAHDLPLVTPSAHDLSAEAVLALDPTVVLTNGTIGPPEVLEQLRDVGIPVVYFDDTLSMDALPHQILAVADVLGVPTAGKQLVARLDAQLSRAVADVPRVEDPLRVAFLYVRGSAGVYLLAGPGSGADELIATVGATDVGTDIGLDQPFTPLTSEAMVDAKPDVILVMTDGLASVGGVDELLALPGIAQTPAAAQRRVVDMADDALLSFGTRTPQVVESLADALYEPTAQ